MLPTKSPWLSRLAIIHAAVAGSALLWFWATTALQILEFGISDSYWTAFIGSAVLYFPAFFAVVCATLVSLARGDLISDRGAMRISAALLVFWPNIALILYIPE